MTPADDVFLAHLTILADGEPCLLARADLLRLLALAGWGPETNAYKEMQEMGDPVLVLREGVLETIRWAREQDDDMP
jgi:hypothetical protein